MMTHADPMSPANLDGTHLFERAGLGKAPFKFVGTEHKTFQAAPGAPVQVGGSCDYCAQGISLFCWIRSADGRAFKVGSECVNKTGDAGLRKLVDAAVRKHNREVRHAREALKIEELRKLLADVSVRETLSRKPHPYQGFRGTLLDFADWNMAHAGAAGKQRILKAVKAALDAP